MPQEPKTICIAGASGLVGSNLVKACLDAGYRVHGTMRDASDPEKAPYLMALPGAEERLKLFSADMAESDSFDAPLEGADAVFIACLTPLYFGRDGKRATEMDDEQGWAEIIRPIEEGCLNIMRAADRQDVREVMICSSTSSTNPPVPVPVKNELDHLSDAAFQVSQKKYTSAEKIVMETSAKAFAAEHDMRVCIFLPTLMLGPVILPEHLERGFHKTLKALAHGETGQHERVPAGSVSMIHLHDIAALFLAAYENPDASDRYFAVYDSWPWRDVYAELARHVPESGLPAPLEAEPEEPTRFDFTRRDSLGVPVRDIPTILAQTIEWIKTEPFGG